MAVVFTDTFNPGSDTALTTYNTDYAYILSTGLTADASDADCRDASETGNVIFARIAAAGVPTGDQEARATILCSNTSQAQGMVFVRGVTSPSPNCYNIWRETGTEYRIYRLDNGAYTQIGASITVTTPAGTAFDVSLRAEGTGPVTLTYDINGTTGTRTDSSGSVIASGYPGIGVYNNGAGVGNAVVQYFEVDDLGGAATVDQQSFRFGADDGSESAHTWLAAQDTNANQQPNTNTLIRFLLQATGAPTAKAFKLQWRRSTEGTNDWKDVT